jgi:hypothetical protein
VPRDPYIREKFTRDLSVARQLAPDPVSKYRVHHEAAARAARDVGLMPKAPTGWSRPFDDPIELPDGRQLVTLEDAGNYITKLPKAEHSAPEWQAAMQALMIVARGGPTMLARIGVMRALHRDETRVFNPQRKETHWGKRKLKRDE